MIKYTWFSSGLITDDRSSFVNVNQLCFASDIQCICFYITFVLDVVLSTLFHQLSFPLKTANLLTNGASVKLFYHKLVVT